MTDYLDLYSRQFLKQTQPEHVGGTTSPDIIPWGKTPNPDTAALTTATSWATDPGVGLVLGADNYLYARTRNPGSAAIPGRMFMGAAKPSFLCWPDTLTALKSKSQKPYIDVKVAADAIGVSADGFVYQPGATGDSLASWIYTAQHPVVLPALRDINAFLQFIRDTPSYVQRSIGFGLSAGKYSFIGPYEQRDVDSVVAFELAWTDCPIGWAVSLLPKSGGTDVSIGPFTINTSNGSLIAQLGIPAGFKTELEFSIDSANIAPLPTTQLEVRVQLQGNVGYVSTGLKTNLGTKVLLQLGGHRWRAKPG
ncbi:MAG: hypothetical protein ACREPB_13435 [Arenimonas sp.]